MRIIPLMPMIPYKPLQMNDFRAFYFLKYIKIYAFIEICAKIPMYPHLVIF